MRNVISLEEILLKRKIKEATESLKDVRTLISYGIYEKTADAKRLELEISNLEESLEKLIEKDSF
jgi:flagellar biosynthesis/type III secretory pathway ATPase